MSAKPQPSPRERPITYACVECGASIGPKRRATILSRGGCRWYVCTLSCLCTLSMRLFHNEVVGKFGSAP